MGLSNGRLRMVPPPGKKLIRDWVGLTVRFRTQLGNGMGRMPAGTLAKVRYAHGGLEVETEPCKCCGLQLRITRVSFTDVEVVEAPCN